MKVYIPFHVGSGNRGCEGILRGTTNILKLSKEDVIALDRDLADYELDKKLHLNDVAELEVKSKRSLALKVMGKMKINRKGYYVSPFKAFFKSANKDSLCLFTGGDLFCYASTIKENCFLLDYLSSKGIKSILYGASIEDRFVTPEVEAQLNRFEKIVCRETETLKVLEKHAINNVFCFPDPAFSLEPEECKLPKIFDKSKVIGLNISNMVNGDSFSLDTLFVDNLKNMLDFILENTEYSVLMIPHVTWERQDDRRMCAEVKKLYAQEDRIDVLNVDDLGYLQIRNIISNCELFIGGRTHSVISAYSTCVPTLALGYSIKARGIAKDLGLDEKLIFDSKKIENGNQLLDSFRYLLEHKEAISQQLQNVMPEYKSRAYMAYDALGVFDDKNR